MIAIRSEAVVTFYFSEGHDGGSDSGGGDGRMSRDQ